MPEREKLTSRYVEALEGDGSEPRIVMDTICRELGLRATGTGNYAKRTFFLYTRFPYKKRGNGGGWTPNESRNPTRRDLGDYHSEHFTLAQARDKARGWLALIAQGIDPKKQAEDEAEERRQEEARRRRDSFGTVAEDFIERHVKKLRSADDMEATIRRDLLGQKKQKDGKWVADPARKTHWRDRPITEITRRDVIGLLEDIVDGGKRHQARKVLAFTRKLFNLACCRFRRHLVRCFDGAGGGRWRSGGFRGSSRLRLSS